MVNADTEIEMKWILLNVSEKIFSEKLYMGTNQFTSFRLHFKYFFFKFSLTIGKFFK